MMRWYEGGIAEAVALTKQKSAIFMVFIQGNDDKSKQFLDLLNHQVISTRLESELFVAVKVEANSVPHQQFTQIYKQATVPSIFFIGKTGAPIGVITEPPTREELKTRIDGIVEIHIGKPTQNESFIRSEQADSDSNIVCENGVCRRVPSEVSTASASSSSEQLLADQKLEKAKELIEKKREQKLLEEKEKERQDELERRKVGQDVQKLKRWQDEQKLKNILEERDREKRAEQAARERVLAQIAQDKADRAARFSNTPPQAQSNPQSAPRPSPSTSSNTARLQFKLPDGSSHTHEFASSEPLEVVRAYITANLNLSHSNYVLSTAFPRREFTDSNDGESLADLGLAPNAVVLVLPAAQSTVATGGAGFARGLFWSIIAPFLSIFDYLKSFVFGGGARQAGSSTGREQGRKRFADTAGEASTSGSPLRRRMGETTIIKRQGNVHRLSDKTDSDDENNTWNGNSTQQM